MIKDIYLFTDQYPYGKGEQFIENEIKYVSSRKDINLIIVPTLIDVNQQRVVPEEIKIDRTLAFSLASNKLTKNPIVFFKSIGLIVKGIFLHKKIKFRSLYQIAWFAHNAQVVKEWAKNKNLSNAILYTYWCNFQLLGLILNNQGIAIYSRVHRHDLYFEENINSFIPFREFVISKVQRIFSISEDGCEYLKRQYVKYSDKIKLSRLGIEDTSKCTTIINRERKDFISVVSCSYISEVKRVDLIAKGLIEFAKEQHDNQVIWNHFGGGNKVLIDNIYSSLEHKPENLQVIFHGDTKNEDIIKFYQLNYVDVFVNTSSSEGIPVSIMESISFGIPVLACNVGGLKEIVYDNGILLDKEFTNIEFSKSISKILTNSHYRTNSRLVYEKLYNAERNYADFYDVITDYNIRSAKLLKD
ncbi:glycosyltransferase [Carboxylicivirga taeanensis]|uniref:glycosyltransferase n=1 Tax=Carboxylicivirga taeanensis TaxID=1416875 RepID=UPI003F6DEE93